MDVQVFVDLLDGWGADLDEVDALLSGRDWSRDPDDAVTHRVLPLDEPGVDGFVARCRAQGATPWVEVGDPVRLRAAAEAGAHLWLRGLEAGGRCGEVGALVLIRAARRAGRPFVVQGLGRRAMGAALAVGASGIVLDAHLWALPDSPLHDDHKRFLAGRRSGRDTRVEHGLRTARGTVVSTDWPTNPGSALPAPTCISELPSEGSLAEVVRAYRDDAIALAERASDGEVLRSDPFGTGRPIVQGPMANVAESNGLARVVADAGGLPFCALGALRPPAADAVLEGMSELEGPWGVGVIGFDVMPYRDAHLASIDRHGGRPVILAGGSPALAVTLKERGHEPWLHTPSARLAGMALKRGVPVVVFEGREAGGHVGQLTSAALWEEGLAVVEAAETPAMAILAGGIGDATSAAFTAAMATDAFASGHRIGLQIGTALFFTHEIVEARQITRAYQQAALAAERTVYVGDTVNLPLQCTPNRYTDQAIASERQMAAEGLALDTRRERVEHHNLGRTRIAAKGIERDGAGGYQKVPTQRQLDEGAFTMGQGALVEDRLTTVEALFSELTSGAAALLRDARPAAPDPFGPVELVVGTPQVREHLTPTRSVDPGEPIAVVGLGCVLPGGNSVPAFWKTLLFGLDAVRPVPATRWRADRYFDPTDQTKTRTGTRMAGLVTDFEFDPLAFGIPPRVVASMDRAQQLALVAASQAISDVRIPDRRRAAVVLGNSMGGEHAKSLAVRVRFREVLAALDAEGAFDGLDEHGLAALSDRVEARLSESLPPVDVESMSGLLSNVIAGRVASWLDLMGGNTTVDAACAASLAAVETAVSWLRTGRSDLVITGGVDADLSPETYVGFSRTHALSGTGSTPFSARADGFVMGEGAAVFALKRLSDAERDGDTIWALLRGIGQSSDGRSSGITAPRAEGQLLAIQRAYAQSGFGPDAVELVEAHGTGTAVGDKTELTALSRIFAGQQAWLGSVKSNIGHLKGGAGAAGLLKAVLSVAHGVIPPTLHGAPLNESLARSPFRLPRTPARFQTTPARASVSAFGFGGTNFHVLIEAPPGDPHPTAVPVVPSQVWEDPVPELRVYAADDAEALLARFRADHTVTPEEAVAREHRLVVLDRPAGLDPWVASHREGAFGTSAWRSSGTIAPAVLVFPGQGSPRDGALSKLHALPASAALYGSLGITDVDTSADPAAQHAMLTTTAIGWAAALSLEVAGVIGHSVGEIGALAAAGVLRPDDALRLAEARGAGLMACPEGRMLAVALDEEAARAFAADTGLHVAALNGPAASVVAGAPDAIDAALEVARERGIRATALDVRRAFHTPDVAPAARALDAVVRTVPLHEGRRWWSNVDGVSDTREAIPEALVRAVTEPVGFVGSVRAAAAEGHRLFVHCGPGAAMARHIEKAVPNARVVCLDPDPADSGIGVVRAAAELLARGHAGLLRDLPARFVTLPFPTEPRAPVREAAEAAFVPPEKRESSDPTSTPATTQEVSVPSDPSDIRSVVLGCIGEVTGYPPEALVSGARLDADLGIDSIRKMEIVGLVQERLDLEIDDASLGELGSLDVDGLVAWLEKRPDAPRTESSAHPDAWGLGWLPAPLARETGEGERLRITEASDAIRPYLQGAPLPAKVVLEGEPADQHAVAAFLRTAAQERGRALRIVLLRGDVPSDLCAAGLGPDSGTVLLTPEGAFESGHFRRVAAGELPENPVVLASGGTTGILAPCLAALPGARGLVFGRRVDQTAPKGFEYRSVDVTDAAAVEQAARECRERFGRIDVVVHAAGVLRDGPLDTRTSDDLDAVMRVKVVGARNLIAATTEDAPIWVPFSSVSAHLRNPGQTLYAAANAALEHLPHPTAVRSIPLVWTAWSDVGMAKDPALQRLLAARGVSALTPEEGSAAFVQALRGDGPVWLAKRPPPSPTLPWPLAGWDTGAHFTIDLDPADPVLVDHSVAGRPLVPAALWVAALVRAAGIHDPSQAWGVADLEILAPCFVGRPETVEIRIEGTTATVQRDGRVLCRASIAPVDDARVADRPRPLDGASATSLYRSDLLFHGPSWQMLVEVGDFEPGGASADVHINGTDALATTIDGAHQLLAAWSGRTTGWLGLPVGAAAWRVAPGPVVGPVRLEIRARVEDGTVLGDITATDHDGRVVVEGSGVRLQAASRWEADA